jgi:peptidoglycan-associated lipoprotein
MEGLMMKKVFTLFLFLLCFGFIAPGCSKKAVVREEPSATTAQPVAEAVRAAELEIQRKAREEDTKKAQAQKDFDKSLVAKKTPGISGEVLETALLKDIHFDFDQYDIRPGDALILEENAKLLMKFPNVKTQIEGHCDERGTEEYNLALGERRADSAKKYLISVGVPEGRISTISYGKERPLDPGHNEEAWAKNRRAHTIILSR